MTKILASCLHTLLLKAATYVASSSLLPGFHQKKVLHTKVFYGVLPDALFHFNEFQLILLFNTILQAVYVQCVDIYVYMEFTLRVRLWILHVFSEDFLQEWIAHRHTVGWELGGSPAFGMATSVCSVASHYKASAAVSSFKAIMFAHKVLVRN